MNYEVNSFRAPHVKEQSYARAIRRALALPLLAPVGALGALGAGALWLANQAALPLWALGAGWTACVAAAAAAVTIFARRAASGIAIPADALRGLAFPDGQLLTEGGAVAGKPTDKLAVLQVEFAALATALVGRLARDSHLASDLARAKEDAQSANLAKSQFLADMSHQLRTPLNAIIGYATLLQEDAAASARAEEMDDLDRILNASRTLLELINYIIDLSRLEAGKTSFQRSILDISSLLFSVVSSFDLKKHGNGNALEVEVSPDIGIMVGDAAKIRQCLLNLISNGLKFTRDGEVRLKVESVQTRAGESIRFSVSDTGVGMSEEQAAGLFQDQGADHESRYNPASGPKLGLAITKRLATLMGGAVEVRSAPGEGSVFTLTVPREMPRTVAAEDPAPRAAKQSIKLPQIGRKALIIDDEPSAIDIAGRWLSRLGYAVIAAADGDEGLELARREKPDLIILDIFMPGRTGHEVMQVIRADEELSAIPVIVVTVLDDRGSVLKSGATDCLTKPVQPRDLEKVLDVYSKRIEGEILVIEDDADAGLLIRRTAAQIGLTSRLARSGEEGLAMIRSERPAAIVLDLGLPGMSGFQVLEEVAADPRLKNIPVIIVSGREISVLEHQVITKAGGIFHPKGHSSPREIAQSLKMVVGS